jgi:peptide subunit release factor 1 (eRF1)
MITAEDLRELAWATAGTDLVVSFYLNVDRRERTAIHCSEVTHQLVREAAAHASDRALPREVIEKLRLDLDRIIQHVGAERRPDRARGLALFACDDRQLWRAFVLPTPVPDLVRVGRTAYLRPLGELIVNNPRAGVALVDRERARFFVVELGAIEELDPVLNEMPDGERRHGHHGPSTQKAANFKLAAAAIETLANERKLDKLLIGGPSEDVRAHIRYLSSEAQKCLVGHVHHLMMTASPDEVLSQARETLRSVLDAERSVLIGELTERVGPGGLATVGIDETLDALYRKAIRTLILDQSMSSAGWRCQGCGRLFRVAGPCPECGDQGECTCDLGESALEETLRQHGDIAILERAPEVEGWDGLAALLRFPRTAVVRRVNGAETVPELDDTPANESLEAGAATQ